MSGKPPLKIDTKKSFDFDDDANEVVIQTDVGEGFNAEYDSTKGVNVSEIKEHPFLKAQTEAPVDIIDQSLEKDVQDLGRQTLLKLAEYPKTNIIIPIDKLNPEDLQVYVGINGRVFQITRGKKVAVPNPILELLIGGGYNPSLAI